MAKKGELPSWANPEALVEVTHTQHMMFHWCNYQLWGNEEDELALRFMRGQTEDKHKEVTRLGGKEAVKARKERRRNDPLFDQHILNNLLLASKLGVKAIAEKRGSSPEFERKYRETRIPGAGAGGKAMAEKRKSDPEFDRKYRDKLSRARSGDKNPAHGKMWITNGEINRRIPVGEPIQEGFRPGMTRINKLAQPQITTHSL